MKKSKKKINQKPPKKRDKAYVEKGVFDLARFQKSKRNFLDQIQAIQLAIEMKLPRGVMNHHERNASTHLLNFFAMIIAHRHERGLITQEEYIASEQVCLEIMEAMTQVGQRSAEKGIETYGSTGDELRIIQDGYAEFIDVLKEEIEERPKYLLKEWNATINFVNKMSADRRKENERHSASGL